MKHVEKAKRIITEQMEKYKNPIVMSSFGKDSMVLLDLIKSCGYKIPILFHREPFYPKKYEFANSVILENDYVVYDYPPYAVGFIKGGDNVEVVNHYQIRDSYNYLPTGIKDPLPGESYLCALMDIYGKPRGTFDYPWDLAFLGHKSSDVDPILGSVPLNKESIDHFAFPLIDFTDKDIWEYTEAHEVRYENRRYNKDDNFKEFKDITYNPDYFPACTNCMDRDQDSRVFCPKVDKFVPNISHLISYTKLKLPEYVGASDGSI